MEKRLKIQIKGQKSIKTDIWTNLHNLQCLISTQPHGCAEIITDRDGKPELSVNPGMTIVTLLSDRSSEIKARCNSCDMVSERFKDF